MDGLKRVDNGVNSLQLSEGDPGQNTYFCTSGRSTGCNAGSQPQFYHRPNMEEDTGRHVFAAALS